MLWLVIHNNNSPSEIERDLRLEEVGQGLSSWGEDYEI